MAFFLLPDVPSLPPQQQPQSGSWKSFFVQAGSQPRPAPLQQASPLSALRSPPAHCGDFSVFPGTIQLPHRLPSGVHGVLLGKAEKGPVSPSSPCEKPRAEGSQLGVSRTRNEPFFFLISWLDHQKISSELFSLLDGDQEACPRSPLIGW